MNTPLKTNKKVCDLVSKLSTVKKEIGEQFIKGTKRSKIEKKYRPAFVTMVWQEIVAIDENWFDGKSYDEKFTGTKSDYSVGNGKKDMRGKVMTEIQRSVLKYGIKAGDVLTLSCFECFMETAINKLYKGFKFQSYECNKLHFDLLKKFIQDNKTRFMLSPVFAEIIEGIRKAKKNTYAHLLLDFCRTLPSHAEDIKLALQKDIVKKGGIVWITVSNRKGKGYKGYNTKEELIKLIKKAGGNRYEFDEQLYPYNYNDDGGMTSIILRRVK